MTLTLQGLEDRRWGNLKVLRRLLSKRPVPDRYFRATTIDEIPPEEEARFQKILALILENEELIRTVPSEDRELITSELEQIGYMARHHGEWHNNEARTLEMKAGEIMRLIVTIQNIDPDPRDAAEKK